MPKVQKPEFFNKKKRVTVKTVLSTPLEENSEYKEEYKSIKKKLCPALILLVSQWSIS